jgi:N6-L-threonylcarbamoyladenine synthase
MRKSSTLLADRAVEQAGIKKADLDAIAVSFAPGLIGAVLVGVNFAKAAALALEVPLIPVHHVRGHIAANYIAYPELEPPFVCLAVSGWQYAAGGRANLHRNARAGGDPDDAAGECFDKTARILGLGYPGGKPVDLLSRGGDDKKYSLPAGNLEDHPYDMSFSGLKTAVLTGPYGGAAGGGTGQALSLAPRSAPR